MALLKPARQVFDSSPAIGDEEVQVRAATDARWVSLGTALARAVRRQCPRWLSDHAEDIAQAALIKVMASSGNGEGERALSSFYLHRVAHSALVDEIRRRQRRREVSFEEGPAEEPRVRVFEPRVAGTPEKEASLRELGRAVRDCLLRMGDDRRRAVTLHLQGHSVPETAQLMGWSVKRAENLVYRGLADLRECVRRKGHQP